MHETFIPFKIFKVVSFRQGLVLIGNWFFAKLFRVAFIAILAANPEITLLITLRKMILTFMLPGDNMIGFDIIGSSL